MMRKIPVTDLEVGDWLRVTTYEARQVTEIKPDWERENATLVYVEDEEIPLWFADTATCTVM